MKKLCEQCKNTELINELLTSTYNCYTCIDYCNWDQKR